MSFYFNHFMEIWLLPPGSILLLAFLGFILWRKRPRLGKFLIGTAFISLWLLSTPFVANLLLARLQYQYEPLSPLKLSLDANAAIVVLEAGLNLNTPEYGKPVVSEGTLTRIRYSAFLHQKTKAPILVSGNDPSHLSINQADYMADSLKDYFGVPSKWKESSGYNTAQEGILSAEILNKAGVKKIYLVTSALHMPRAMYSFQNRGLEVIPAPTGFKEFDALHNISVILPSIKALAQSAAALREYIGILWYLIYYRF